MVRAGEPFVFNFAVELCRLVATFVPTALQIIQVGIQGSGCLGPATGCPRDDARALPGRAFGKLFRSCIATDGASGQVQLLCNRQQRDAFGLEILDMLEVCQSPGTTLLLKQLPAGWFF